MLLDIIRSSINFLHGNNSLVDAFSTAIKIKKIFEWLLLNIYRFFIHISLKIFIKEKENRRKVKDIVLDKDILCSGFWKSVKDWYKNKTYLELSIRERIYFILLYGILGVVNTVFIFKYYEKDIVLLMLLVSIVSLITTLVKSMDDVYCHIQNI